MDRQPVLVPPVQCMPCTYLSEFVCSVYNNHREAAATTGIGDAGE